MEDAMTKRMFALALVSLALVAFGPRARAAEPVAEAAAKASAEAWLTLVDQAKYPESWEQSAKLFKGAVTKDQWHAALGAARGPLGKLVSRTLKSSQYTKTMPGAPDGQYVVIQYDSVFEKKAQAVETITPMADPDGEWRVSGYRIR
jgi:hypothetical protein